MHPWQHHVPIHRLTLRRGAAYDAMFKADREDGIAGKRQPLALRCHVDHTVSGRMSAGHAGDDARRHFALSTHLPFPSVCRVAVHGDAFRCVPVFWDF